MNKKMSVFDRYPYLGPLESFPSKTDAGLKIFTIWPNAYTSGRSAYETMHSIDLGQWFGENSVIVAHLWKHPALREETVYCRIGDPTKLEELKALDPGRISC